MWKEGEKEFLERGIELSGFQSVAREHDNNGITKSQASTSRAGVVIIALRWNNYLLFLFWVGFFCIQVVSIFPQKVTAVKEKSSVGQMMEVAWGKRKEERKANKEKQEKGE